MTNGNVLWLTVRFSLICLIVVIALWSTLCSVYRITCQLCSDIFIGESSRIVHDRLSEHLRFANNPIAPSYNEEAMAVHYYRQKHLGETANLKFELIKTESNSVLRKIYEAFYICKEKPIINDKSEVKILHRLLVQGDVILSR